MKKKTVTKKRAAAPKKAKSSLAPVAVGAGIAALTAAAAGTYFLYGSKHAARHRRLVKAWSLKARGEILERLEQLSEINETAYNKAIKEVSAQYKTLHRLNPKDVAEFVGELKGHWQDIAREIKTSVAAATPPIRVLSAKKKAKKRK